MPPRATRETIVQASLFDAIRESVSQEPRKSQRCSLPKVASPVEDARKPRPRRVERPWRDVPPLADILLGDVCGFCGDAVRPPEFVILDCEELGAFCNEECADRRFRLYLAEGADDDEGSHEV